MRKMESLSEQIKMVETLMLTKYRTEPFHNLQLLFGPTMRNVPGGTCSDKTLSFIKAAKQLGFDASLHTASIGDQEIHRLARLRMGECTFFADIGNGWPALHLYPADREVVYHCFGMRFRTVIEGPDIFVRHQRNGRESLQLRIDVRARPEEEVMQDIASRFTSGINYPFSDSLRFSMVRGDQFQFLRGDRVFRYEETQVSESPVETQDIASILLEHFDYDIRPYLASL